MFRLVGIDSRLLFGYKSKVDRLPHSIPMTTVPHLDLRAYRGPPRSKGHKRELACLFINNN